MTEGQWYACYTRARHELRVMEALGDLGVETYCPLIPRTRRWHDRERTVLFPLFPGYVFARLPSEQAHSVLQVPGVDTVIRKGDVPSPIPNDEMNNLRHFVRCLAATDIVPASHPMIGSTKRRVRGGIFDGVVVSVGEAEGRQRFLVGLDVLGQGAELRVDPKVLGPVDNEFVAIGNFDGQLRVLSLTHDGRYTFVDPRDQTHSILYVLGAEFAGLRNAVEELEDLINSEHAKENDFQRFFESHPDFLLEEGHVRAHPHVVLVGHDEQRLIPDFVLEPRDQGRLCDLLELKKPSANVFVNRKGRVRFAAAILDAAAQLREYGLYFEEKKNRERIRDVYGLNLYRPKMVVVAGRRGTVSPIAVRKAEQDLPNIQVRTYDEVLLRVKQRLQRFGA